MTTDLLGHTHSWSPAGQHCSRNIPGVSLVLPNQFLEGLGRVTGCSHVPRWLCLEVPQGSPHICKVTREEQRGSSLPLKALEEPPSPLVSPGMGPPALSLTSPPCKLLLCLQKPKGHSPGSPSGTDFSPKQDPVGEVSTPLYSLFSTCLGGRRIPTSAP